MGPRPAHLNLSNSGNDGDLPPPRYPNFFMDLPSPRAGEVPPALSPLDAFALHSRMLAKRFEEEAQAGRRLSRLPHEHVAKELANRPEYFRSVSGGSDVSELPDVQEEEPQRPSTRGERSVAPPPFDRPKSHYPMLGRISKEKNEYTPVGTPFHEAPEYQPTSSEPQAAADYFGIPRASSPEPVDPAVVNVEAPSPAVPSLTNSVDSFQSPSHPRTMTNGSTYSQRSERGLLAAKTPAYPPRSPRSVQSIRSVRQDSGDDDAVSINGSQTVSSSRKFSTSSGVRSRPQSPFSPYTNSVHRSPSMASDYSMNSSQPQLPKPAFNFSRPLSSHGSKPSITSLNARPSFDSRGSFDNRPSLEQSHRPSATRNTSASTAGSRSRQTSGDDVATPFAEVPTPSDPHHEYFTTQNESSYDLPRGRHAERSSAEQRVSWINRQFTWDDPLDPSKQSHSQQSTPSIRAVSPSPSEKLLKLAVEETESREKERQGRARAFSSVNRSQSADPRGAAARTPTGHSHSPSVMTDSTDRTIRATPLHQRAASAELTAEEHLEIGIQAHSSGALSKSTYHLRLAARAGLPTAALLYALACRHGWGMRPNQAEGVAWLRKAIDGSGLEIADVEGTIANSSGRQGKGDPVAEAAERRKRKAQFALAIYELGISYMNGWGCPKDKPLAVRCYEVAGNWGDCDALAEAGFCYTQGQGCKKDLKKAAALYRKAAEGGMSMAGNSWYVSALHRFGHFELLLTSRLQDLQSEVHRLRDHARERQEEVFLARRCQRSQRTQGGKRTGEGEGA